MKAENYKQDQKHLVNDFPMPCRIRFRDLFGRHVSDQVATAALHRTAETGGVELGGVVREVSVLFVDLVGSTTLAATPTTH